MVGSLFPSPYPAQELPECTGLEVTHDAMETYQCADDHKTYALRNKTHQLFILFASNVPTYALR